MSHQPSYSVADSMPRCRVGRTVRKEGKNGKMMEASYIATVAEKNAFLEMNALLDAADGGCRVALIQERNEAKTRERA